MLRLQKATVAAILRWAHNHPTIEVCGLVWRTPDGHTTAWPLRNIHPEPTKYYRTAPRDVREAFEHMDLDGGEPLAWYHSHPGGKPDPSEEDMRGAFNTGMHYLIAHPDKRDPELWRLSVWECLEMGILVEAEYQVIP